MQDPIIVCYLATLLFLLGVLAAMVFGPPATILALWQKRTLTMYVVAVFLSIAAGSAALLLWSRLRNPPAP
jgi:hypothetical protein